MATATASHPKSKSKISFQIPAESIPIDGPEMIALSETDKTTVLRELLHPTAGDATRWKGLLQINSGELSDDTIRSRLIEIWPRQIKVAKPDGMASAKGGKPLVWFHHEGGTPSLSGEELFDAIRAVLGAKAEALPGDLPAKGDKSGKGKPKPATSVAELLADVVVIDERDVPFAKIKRSPENPRQVFDEDLIREMAPNITTICQLNPLTIREGTFELIDGETRHRAADLGDAKLLRCKIVRCSDAAAACLRLMTSLQRRDLNPMERAAGIKALIDRHGLSQREAAATLKMEQGSISNLVRLLDLPAEWQSLVRDGSISTKAARQAVLWINEPSVLKEAMLDLRARVEKDEWSAALPDVLNDAARGLSRPLKGYYHDTKGISGPVDLRVNESQIAELRVRCVGKEDRAFNVDLWNTLRLSPANKARDRFPGKSPAAKSDDPAQAAKRKKELEQAFAKRVWRVRVTWLQRMCVDRLAPGIHDFTVATRLLLYFATQDGYHVRRESANRLLKVRDRFDGERTLAGILASQDVCEVANTLVREWVGGPFEGYHTALKPAVLATLAGFLGVDMTRDWTASIAENGPAAGSLREFLELLTKEQLAAQAKEWKVDLAAEKRNLMVDALIAAGRDKPCPVLLRSAKEVSL